MINVEQMLADLDVAISECLVIPNEWLPEEYHDDVRGGRKQVTGHDIDCELDYSENETDELQQHKNEMAFVGGMISSGMIDASDLEEE